MITVVRPQPSPTRTAPSEERPKAPVSVLAERRAQIILGALMAAYVACMALTVLAGHARLGTFCFDLGIHHQAAWLVSHGLNPFLTTRGVPLMAEHFAPIAYLLAPLLWVWDGPETLLVAQTVIFAAGAIPAYHLARGTLRSRRMALGFAALYLLQPALGHANRFEVHFNALAATFLLFAIWALEAGRTARFWVAAVLAMMCTEFAGLSIMLLGVEAWRLGRRRLSVLVVVAGLGALLLSAAVMRLQNGGQPSPYIILYQGYGTDLPSILIGIASHPLQTLASLNTGINWEYAFDLLAPLAFLPLLAPARLLPALPLLLGNLLSWRQSQHEVDFHYAVALLPFLTWAAVLGARRIQEWLPPRLGLGRRRACLAGLLALAAAAALWRGPLTRELRPASQVAAARALAAIPPDASVSAENDLGGHLGGRREAYLFPNPFQTAAWGGTPQALVEQTGMGAEPLSPGAFRRAVRDTRIDYLVFHPKSPEGFPLLIPDRFLMLTFALQAPEYGIFSEEAGLIALRRGLPHRPLATPVPTARLRPWLETPRR